MLDIDRERTFVGSSYKGHEFLNMEKQLPLKVTMYANFALKWKYKEARIWCFFWNHCISAYKVIFRIGGERLLSTFRRCRGTHCNRSNKAQGRCNLVKTRWARPHFFRTNCVIYKMSKIYIFLTFPFLKNWLGKSPPCPPSSTAPEAHAKVYFILYLMKFKYVPLPAQHFFKVN